MGTDISQAINYARSGKTSEARQLAEANLVEHPEDAETWHLLGLLDNMSGTPTTAVTRFRRAISLNPNVAKYHSNFGNALLKINQTADAEQEYRRALELDPGHLPAAFNLAALLQDHARFEEAIKILTPFDNGKDETGETDLLLGKLFEKTDQAQKALAHFKTAVSLNPSYAEAWAQLAILQEITNQTDDAQISVIQGLALAPNLPDLLIVKARLLRRNKQFEQAIQTLSELELDVLPDIPASHALNQWGTNLDRLDRPSEAMEKFIAAKKRQAQSQPDISMDAQNYLAHLDKALTRDYSQLANQIAPENDPDPVFLIAFPRSGTTLLDQILDSHPSIQTLEEKPLITTLIKAHPEIFETGDVNVKPLIPTVRKHLQQLYFDLAAQHVDIVADNIWVDKLPLNITLVPQILQIFPRARFILALRHTCDVVLSSQMHLFKLNAAMAHFQTLEDTAQLYAKVMKLWRKFNLELEPSHHVVRYENLISQFEEEISSLLGYLNLPWDERLRQHTEHAKNRGRINTPSYHQVTEPLYTRASGRWIRYRNELAPVLPVLEPAMQYLGYTALTDQTHLTH